MKILNLKRHIQFSRIIKKQNTFTEFEINVLLCIHLMNEEFERCSFNTLKKYMQLLKHTPNNLRLRNTIQQLKSREMVKSYGKGAGINIKLSLLGKLQLIDIENGLSSLRFKKTSFL